MQRGRERERMWGRDTKEEERDYMVIWVKNKKWLLGVTVFLLNPSTNTAVPPALHRYNPPVRFSTGPRPQERGACQTGNLWALWARWNPLLGRDRKLPGEVHAANRMWQMGSARVCPGTCEQTHEARHWVPTFSLTDLEFYTEGRYSKRACW